MKKIVGLAVVTVSIFCWRGVMQIKSKRECLVFQSPLLKKKET